MHFLGCILKTRKSYRDVVSITRMPCESVVTPINISRSIANNEGLAPRIFP